MGFLYFAPFYDKSFTFNIYGFNKHTSIKTFSDKILDPIFWPVSMKDFKAKINFHTINNDEIKISNLITIKTQIHHHPNGTFSYNILIDDKKITYITDCEYISGVISEKLIKFANKSDLPQKSC